MSLPASRIHLILLSAALLLALCTPFAVADSISLTSNSIGVSGSVGTVTLTDNGGGSVLVTITMNPGFTIKLQGGQVGFNTTASLSAGSFGPITIMAGGNTYTGLSFNQFKTSQNVSQFGTFTFDLANFKGGPNGTTSADQLSFVISGASVDQFSSFVIHFCNGSGTNCAPQTGFASNGPPTAVPEPGSLSLLGTGLITLAGIARRRFLA